MDGHTALVPGAMVGFGGSLVTVSRGSFGPENENRAALSRTASR